MDRSLNPKVALPSSRGSGHASSTAVGVAIACALASGCGESSGPSPAAAFDPAESATRAIAAFDQDKDGRLKKTESASLPPLAEYFTKIDADGDGSMTVEELANRFAVYRSPPDPIPVGIFVNEGFKAAEGAVLRLIPESFMGGGFSTREGTADPSGQARWARIEGSRTPENFFLPGLYTLEVEYEGKAIRRGLEIAADSEAILLIDLAQAKKP